MFLVTLSAKGGLATGRIFLGLVGGIYGEGINLVLDTGDSFQPKKRSQNILFRI